MTSTSRPGACMNDSVCGRWPSCRPSCSESADLISKGGRVGVQTVIFDWGGTLTPWHTLQPREAWIATVADDEVADRLLAAETELWLRSRDEHRSGTLEDVYAAAGMAPTEAMRAAFRDWWEPHTLLDPD